VETPAPQERFDLGARTPQQLEVFMLSIFFLHGATCTVLKQSILLSQVYSSLRVHVLLVMASLVFRIQTLLMTFRDRELA